MNRKFSSGQKTQVGKVAMDALTSLDPSFEAAQRLVSHPQLAARLKALFEELSASFPCQINASDLIPEKWEVVEDVEPRSFKVGDLKFKSFLQGDETYVGGDTMRQRAVELKGNLGLSDAKYFLEHQSEIPTELRGKYIVFAGTVMRGSGGSIHVPFIYFNDGRWVLGFDWLGCHFNVNDRVACSE